MPRSKDRERRKELLLELTSWRQRYREAFVRWRAKEPDVRFPTGTYALRLLCDVTCERAPPRRSLLVA